MATMDEEDGKNGYKVTARILQSFDEKEAPVLTLYEIAKELDISLEDAREELNNMNAEGMVQCKVVEGDESIWWPTAKPNIDPEAETLLMDDEYDEPLSIEDIHEITSKWIDQDG